MEVHLQYIVAALVIILTENFSIYFNFYNVQGGKLITFIILLWRFSEFVKLIFMVNFAGLKIISYLPNIIWSENATILL